MVVDIICQQTPILFVMVLNYVHVSITSGMSMFVQIIQTFK